MTSIFFLIASTLFFHQNVDCQVPDHILEVLNEARPGYEIISPSKIVNDWNDFISTDCPTVVIGEFSGDSLVDYALLIEKDNEPFELVVIQSRDEQYRMNILMKMTAGVYDRGYGFGISKFDEPDLADGVIKLPNDAILYVKFESSSAVFYYRNKDFVKYWLGD